MNAPQNPPASITCAKCHAPNAAVARFCGVCGATLLAAPPGPPPHIPPPPPQPPREQRFAVAGPAGAQATIDADIQTAFGLVLQGVQASGAQVQSQSSPYSVRFVVTKRGFLQTAGAKAAYDGEVSLSPLGSRQAVARVTLKIRSSSISTQIALGVVAILLVGSWLGSLGLLLALASTAWTIWSLSSKLPRELAEQMVAAIPAVPAGVAHGGWSPSPSAYAPSPASAPVHDAMMNGAANGSARAPGAPGTPGANGPRTTSPVERLKQLAELRAVGALTPEEFEAKKAELLRRI